MVRSHISRGFDTHFPNAHHWVLSIFSVLVDHLCIFLKKCLFKSFPPRLNWVLCPFALRYEWGVELLRRVVRKGLPEERTFKWTPEEGEEASHQDVWEEQCRKGKQWMQRPWGKSISLVCKAGFLSANGEEWSLKTILHHAECQQIVNTRT